MCQKLALTLWIKTIIYFPFLLLFAALIATFRLKLNTVSSFFCDSASSAGAWWYFSGTGTHFVIKGNKKDGSVKKKWLFKERRCKYLISLLCNTTLLWEFTLLRDLTFSFSWWELDEQISFSVKVKDKYQALTVMPANLAIYRYQKTYQPSGSKT